MRALDLPQSSGPAWPPTLEYARQHPFPANVTQNRSYLVHKDIHGWVERDPRAGGHGQEAEPHAHVEPLTDAGSVQQLRLLRRPGRVLPRLLWRLGAATWKWGGRSSGGPRSWRAFSESRLGHRTVQPVRAHPEGCNYQQPAVPAASRAPQAYTEARGAPKVLLLFPQPVARDRPPDRPLLFSPSAPAASVCTPPGHKRSLLQGWPREAGGRADLGSFGQPGGHFPTSLLSGCWALLQPMVSPVSTKLEPVNCWFDTEPMVVG